MEVFPTDQVCVAVYDIPDGWLKKNFSLTQLVFQWNKEESHTEILATVGIICTLLFLVEVVMKNIAFTPRGYLQSRRNRYDLFVTVMGVIWMFFHIMFKVRICKIVKCCQLIFIQEFRVLYLIY